MTFPITSENILPIVSIFVAIIIPVVIVAIYFTKLKSKVETLETNLNDMKSDIKDIEKDVKDLTSRFDRHIYALEAQEESRRISDKSDRTTDTSTKREGVSSDKP